MSVERDRWYEGEATHAGVAAAFRAVRPDGAEALLGRLRAQCTQLLGKAHRVPPGLLDVVLASGDVELQLALAEAEFAGTAALCALARLGRPELGRALCTFRRNDWDPAEVMAAVMAAADPADPGWRAPDGLVPWLVEGDHVFRHELLYTPFGEVLAATLVRIGSRMPPDLLLDRVRGLRELVGPAEFADFVRRAREEDELGHPGLLARIDEEPAGPPDPTGLWLLATRRARTERGSTVINWDLVRAEQARNPCPAYVLTRLVMEPDCPEDLVREAYRHDRAVTARLAHRLPDDLSVDPELEHDPKWWPEFIRRRQRYGWLSADRVLAEIAPAVDALRCLDAHEPGNRKAIAELVVVWERGGADAVRALLDDVTPPARQGRTAAPPFDAEVARYVREALAEPEGLDRMRRYAATAGDPAHVVAEIRRGSDAIRYLTDEGVPIPWPELVAARAVRPLTLGPVDALVQRPDCPREILLDGLRLRPNAYTGRASWVRDSIERGTLTVRDISAHCAPAGMALMLTMGVPITTDPQEHERWIVRDLRAAGAIDRLGDSVEAWTIAIRMLPEFPGTLLELLDTVAAIVAVGQ
ncbi:hypothetical protein OG948_41620 (plasmid) [Embleya sp. NBC_00888]|uniref:hypothetical protein n=1 Tax=Embleya sp. NBC_00888 TaxID=2975960 RepID=UPI002F919607|nr:hypothetical protein OG948_41620 [Embleya sp. NBC_00888]